MNNCGDLGYYSIRTSLHNYGNWIMCDNFKSDLNPQSIRACSSARLWKSSSSHDCSRFLYDGKTKTNVQSFVPRFCFYLKILLCVLSPPFKMASLCRRLKCTYLHKIRICHPFQPSLTTLKCKNTAFITYLFNRRSILSFLTNLEFFSSFQSSFEDRSFKLSPESRDHSICHAHTSRL